MNKTKLDDRIGNAMNAFFDTQTDPSHFALTYSGNETALVMDKPTLAEKADKWIWILREVFLFGPGTFFLFQLTLTLIYIYPEIASSPNVTFSFRALIMLAAPAFMTYAGSGHLKETKNLIVPATIIALAIAVALVASLFSAEEQQQIYFGFSLYLLPIVWVAGKLVQSWVADKK